MNSHKLKNRLLLILIFVVLILFMIPFFILILNTFKTTAEFTKAPFALPKQFSFDNYKVAIEKMNFFMAFKNTAIITITATLLNTLIASMTGYFFSRKNWKVNKIIFALFLASMVAPFQVYMIPLVRIYGGMLGFSNNLMMVAYIAVGLNIPDRKSVG